MEEYKHEMFYIVRTKKGYDVVYATDLEHDNSKRTAKGIEEIVIKAIAYDGSESDTARELLRIVNDANAKRLLIKDFSDKKTKLFRYEKINPEED